MDVFNNNGQQPVNEFYKLGREFAAEGLTEEYLKYNTQEELESFRQGFKDGLALQPEASIPAEEFNIMGKR